MKTWLRLLVVLMTVGGGFTGLSITFGAFERVTNAGSLTIATLWIFMAMYAFVAAAGLLFVYDPNKTGPILVAFALQIPWLSLPVLEYHFAAGLSTAIAFGPARVAQDALSMVDLGGHFETAFQFSFGTVQEGPWRIGINLIAAMLFVLAWLSARTPSKKQP